VYRNIAYIILEGQEGPYTLNTECRKVCPHDSAALEKSTNRKIFESLSCECFIEFIFCSEESDNR